PALPRPAGRSRPVRDRAPEPARKRWRGGTPVACVRHSDSLALLLWPWMSPPLLLPCRLFLELPAGLLVHEVVGPPVALQRGRSQVLGEPNPSDGVLDELVLELLLERCVLADEA